MRVILDTGPLVALLNRADAHHAWAKRELAQLEAPLWTCEAVLAEAGHLTGKPGVLVEMLSDRRLRVGLDLEDQAASVAALLTRYVDRMDLADACVVRMSELHRKSVVMTIDRRDFSVYRRNGREAIPLIAP